MTDTPILTVDDLRMQIKTKDGLASVLNGVSLHVGEQEIVGLIGETGAGKSLTGWGILGLLPPNCQVTGGSVKFDGVDLLALAEPDRRAIRGKDLAVIVQNPRGALDPLRSVGKQIQALNRLHGGTDRAESRKRMLRALELVGIPDAEQRQRAYPHQLSGGMAQRVLIAMAMVNEPKLIIADEPTTGLDLTIQAQVLDLLRQRVTDHGSSVLLITHDLGVVANYCDRVAVMFAGRIVEQASVKELFHNPQHPYTRALIAASGELPPGPGGVGLADQGQLLGRNSSPPDLLSLPAGCHYAYRCPFRSDVCAEPVPDRGPGPEHPVLCHLPRVEALSK